MKKLLYFALLLALFIIIFGIVDASFDYKLPHIVSIPAIVIFASLFWIFIRRAIIMPFEQRNKGLTYDEKAKRPSTLEQKASKDIVESDIPNLNLGPLSTSHQKVQEKGSIQETFSAVFVIVICISVIACTIWKQHDRKFSGYLYPICENGLYGYIDSVGNRIIEPKFLWVSTFHNGLAMAVVDTIYRQVPDSMAYEVGVRDTIINVYRMYAKYGYIDKSGDFVIEPQFTSYVNMPEMGYVTKDMDDCSNALYRHTFSNRRAMFCDTTTWKNGYIDIKGNIAIEAKYYYSEPFSQGKAVVRDNVGEPLFLKEWCITPSKLRCAYIDTTGNSITDFKFEKLSQYNGRCGIGSYKEVLSFSSDGNGNFTEHNYIIDAEGNVGKDLGFWNEFYGFSRDGISITRQVMHLQVYDGMQDSYSFIDEKGNYLKPLKGLTNYQLDSLGRCDDIMEVWPEDVDIAKATYFSNGFAGISPDGKHWFVIDKYLIIHGYGKESIFDGFRPFINGLAAVKKNGKWGFINLKIKEQIPCKYDSCGYAYPHLVKVYDLNSDRSIKTTYWINRSDSVVWQSNVCSQIEDTKSKSEWGKWHYRPVVIPSCIYKVYLPIFACIFIILLTLLAQMKHSSQYKVEYKK